MSREDAGISAGLLLFLEPKNDRIEGCCCAAAAAAASGDIPPDCCCCCCC